MSGNKKFRSGIFGFFLSATLIIVIVMAAYSLWESVWGEGYYNGPAGSASVEIDIPMGSSTGFIASILQENGLIQNTRLFRLVSRYEGYDGHLKAGHYLLSSTMNMEDLLTELQKGLVLLEGIRFTIPEGFTVEETGARLEEQGLVKKEVFLDFCLTYEETDSDFLRQIFAEVPPQTDYKLEGFLFPDTYEVFSDATEEDIVKMMLNRFLDVFNDDCRQRAEEMGLSVYQVINLASLVEKEAVNDEDRPLVSAVFHNRLNSADMPLLQSCATIQYILGEPKPILTYADLEIESPYNTYIHPGLPPGPIASPGRRAIEAALYPADVDYLFFVAKEDGSGGHYFSKTLQEHNRYKDIAQQNREK